MKKLPRLSPIAAAAKCASRRPALLPAGAIAAALAMSMNVHAQEQAAEAAQAPAAAEQPETNPEFAAAEQGDVAALPEVTATGQQLDSYKPVSSSIGAKMPAAIRDIPQTVNIVNRALLDAQNATTLTDALRNVPGITMAAGEGGQIGDNVNLRGFTARTDIYLDGMRDRGQYKRDTFALDAVEVLKGPSSLFFGRGSTGGVINQVTKLPLQEEINALTASVGTDGWYRATADINEPLSDHSAYRVAAMYQDVDSTRDVVNNTDWGVAPSLRTALNDKTDLTLSGLVQHNRDIPDYGIPFNEGRPANVDMDRYFGNTDDYFDQDTFVAKAKVEHRYSANWKLVNQTQATQTKLAARPTPYRVCTVGFNNAGSAPTGPCPPAAVGDPLTLVTLQSDRRDRALKDQSVFNQTDLIGSFDTGAIRHTIVAGGEIGRDQTYNQAFTWSPRVTQNFENFTPGATTPGETRTQAATHTEGNGKTLGLYANDTVAFSDEWKLTTGLRWDRFKAIGQTVTNATGATTTLERTDHNLSGRAGLVYQPNKVQSWYVAYGTSFNPSTEAVTLSAAQAPVAPERTRSYEIGTRWEVLDEKLSLSSALFRVDKFDARTTDPVTTVVSLDGDTRVQGFELGAVGRISHAWQITAGYTFLDSEIVHSKDIVQAVVGPGAAVPVPAQGKDLPNTPKNSGSLWSSYKFLHDFEVGGGTYYVGKRYITNSNMTSVDGYWRMDGTFAFHQPVYDVQLNVQNLLDEEYYDSIVASENGRAVPGRGLTAIASVTYKF